MGWTLKYSIIRAKVGVCKVTGMVFRCLEDANNFKNVSNHFGVNITNIDINTFYSIWASKNDPINEIKNKILFAFF